MSPLGLSTHVTADNGQKSPGCLSGTLTAGNARSATQGHFLVYASPRGPAASVNFNAQPSPRANPRPKLTFCPAVRLKSILNPAADEEGPARLGGFRSITAEITPSLGMILHCQSTRSETCVHFLVRPFVANNSLLAKRPVQ